MVLKNVLVPAIIWSVVVITAPAAATFVASVTSALASMPSSLVLSPSANAPSLGLICNVETVTALIPAKSVTSESITAPAAATLVASVTSALASMPDNFVRSALVIIAPDPALVISLRSAAAIVMSAEPSKLLPAISLAVDNLVDVAAFPSIEPLIVELNVFVPAMV